MSTLKVDTIQPNASDRLFVSSTLEVDGSQLLVNNALNVSGNASITGSLSAATITSNGTIAANGNVTGVSNLDCSTIVATGDISSGSISSGTGTFSGAVSSNGKDVFRTPYCGTATTTQGLVAISAGDGPSSSQFPVDGYVFDPAGTADTITLQTTVGSPSASWVTVGSFYRALRLTFPDTVSNNYARLVTAIINTELGDYSVCVQPVYIWGSTTITIFGLAGSMFGTPATCRFHFMIDSV